MQPSFEITHHPIDLSRHGLNTYGQSVYRVVWADSRKSKVICRGKMHILPRYAHGDEASCKGHWVLEKWAPASVIIGMTRQQYEAMVSTIDGAAAEEYPDQGDWELSRVFNEDSGPFSRHIDESALHAQLEFHEHRNKGLTLNDRKVEAEEAEDKKQADADKAFDAMFEQVHEEVSCQQH